MFLAVEPLSIFFRFVCSASDQQRGERLCQILANVPTIGDLYRLGSPFGSGSREFSGAIATDHFNAWVALEPGRDAFS